MDLENRKRLKRYAYKARSILNSNSEVELTVKPWNPGKIKRSSQWFGNNERVQEIISNFYKTPK